VYKPTIGADFHSKKLEIVENDEAKTVTLQVNIGCQSLIDMGHCRPRKILESRRGILSRC